MSDDAFRRSRRARESDPLEISVREGEHIATATARHIATMVAELVNSYDATDIDDETSAKLDRLCALVDFLPIQLTLTLAPHPGSLHPDALLGSMIEDNAKRVARLAATFHVLRDADGIEPWDPALLTRWTKGREHGSASRHAGQFVLSVWQARNPEGRRFCVSDAMAKWDAHNRAAVVAWAAHPWWA